MSVSNSSIWPIARTLLGATTPGQSGLGSNGNVLCFDLLTTKNAIQGDAPEGSDTF